MKNKNKSKDRFNLWIIKSLMIAIGTFFLISIIVGCSLSGDAQIKGLIIPALITIILNLVASMMIMFKKWDADFPQHFKVLFGATSLLFSLITLTIFVLLSEKSIKKWEQEQIEKALEEQPKESE